VFLPIRFVRKEIFAEKMTDERRFSRLAVLKSLQTTTTSVNVFKTRQRNDDVISVSVRFKWCAVRIGVT